MTVKLVVIHPRQNDIEAFETIYNPDHVPMAAEKLAGKTKIVASKTVGSSQGTPPFHRVAKIHFPTMEALQACAVSDGGKQTIANAVAISSGGAPIFLIAEEETFWVPGRVRRAAYDSIVFRGSARLPRIGGAAVPAE